MAIDAECTKQFIALQQGHDEDRCLLAQFNRSHATRITVLVGRVLSNIDDMNRLLCAGKFTEARVWTPNTWFGADIFHKRRRHSQR